MCGDSGEHDDAIQPPAGGGLLPRHLCRVIGLNQNFKSQVGTGYHIQIEDRGPVFDDASEAWVRRVNMIVYASYGEPNARIVYGRDQDFPDLRTQAHNAVIQGKIQELASDARSVVEKGEERQAARIKSLLRHYYQSRDEAAKAEFEEANRLYPFVFARAWQELKQEQSRPVAEPTPPVEPAAEADVEEVVYPLDPAQRELVLEIERIREDLERDLATLKAEGGADDILLATCGKMMDRAHESVTHRGRGETSGDFAARRLEMTKNSLVTTYRQVRGRLTRRGRA